MKIQSVTDEIAETLGAKENEGALISAVTPDGPAAKGGIQAGDVILRIDGHEVKSMRTLPRLVSRTAVGKSIAVEVLRKGKRQVVQVVVGRLDEVEKKKEAAAASATPGDGTVLLGMTLAPIDEALRKRFSINGKVAKGVVVTDLAATSPAGRKGIKAGDVIVEAAQDPVATVADVAKAIEKIRKAGRRALLLRVEDAKGLMRFVAVPIQ